MIRISSSIATKSLKPRNIIWPHSLSLSPILFHSPQLENQVHLSLSTYPLIMKQKSPKFGTFTQFVQNLMDKRWLCKLKFYNLRSCANFQRTFTKDCSTLSFTQGIFWVKFLGSQTFYTDYLWCWIYWIPII